MKIQDFIIGVLVAMACIGTIIGYAYFMNQSLGVSIDPMTDNLLTNLNNNATVVSDTTKGVVNDVRSKAPGGEDSGESNADQSAQDNLILQGWRAIVGIPKSFTAFNKIVSLLETNIGMSHTSWSGIALASITFILSILLISAVMKQYIPL